MVGGPTLAAICVMGVLSLQETKVYCTGNLCNTTFNYWFYTFSYKLLFLVGTVFGEANKMLWGMA